MIEQIRAAFRLVKLRLADVVSAVRDVDVLWSIGRADHRLV
ncbi:hypothetical protein [Actinoallomurus purpureus]|nr:hypothetical protein [Actinoallomurus purpureus]